MGKGIPDRWLDYSPCGYQINGTPFIAFKVPLKEAYCNNLPPAYRFSPRNLTQLVENLGLIVDLTATNRYYNPQEFESDGIQHEKIICCGGGVVPNEFLVQRFFHVVDNFLSNSRNASLVGVHCTHGLNRTGYFVCRYMIERMGWPPNHAIAEFEAARGHSMERQIYVDSLLGRPTRNTDYHVPRSRRKRESAQVASK